MEDSSKLPLEHIHRMSLRDLDDLIRGNDVESLISTNERLTLAEIRAIRSNRSLPSGYDLV